MSESSTLRMPAAVSAVLISGGGVIGACLGFGVKPLVRWILDLMGSAPGPLRLAAAMPTAWAVPVLAVLGVVGGVVLAATARRGALELHVTAEGVTLTQRGIADYVPRESVTAVFLDRGDLVLVNAETRVLARRKATDLRKSRVREAFEDFGYPWSGTSDPHEQEYSPWVDGAPGLDERAHGLLRTRARALADERRGAVADATDELQAIGVVPRDRDGRQQYRVLPQHGRTSS